MTGWLEPVGEASLTLLLGLVLLLDTVPLLGVLIPADVAVLAATTAGGPAGAVSIVLAVVAGTATGFSMTFLAGRFFGGPIRRSRIGRRIGEDRWAGAERLVEVGGARMVVAAPFLPIFNTLVPLAAGTLHMPYWRFLRAAVLGSALWATGYVLLGTGAQAAGGLILGDSPLGSVLFMLPGIAIGWLSLAAVRRRMLAADRPAGGRRTCVVNRRRLGAGARYAAVVADLAPVVPGPRQPADDQPTPAVRPALRPIFVGPMVVPGMVSAPAFAAPAAAGPASLVTVGFTPSPAATPPTPLEAPLVVGGAARAASSEHCTSTHQPRPRRVHGPIRPRSARPPGRRIATSH